VTCIAFLSFANLQELVEYLCDILFLFTHHGLKRIVLKLLMIFASVCFSLYFLSIYYYNLFYVFNFQVDVEVNNNVFIDYLMSDQLFDVLIHLFNTQPPDGCRILLLFVIFLNYKKNSVCNFSFILKYFVSTSTLINVWLIFSDQ